MNNKMLAKLIPISFVIIQLILVSNSTAIAKSLELTSMVMEVEIPPTDIVGNVGTSLSSAFTASTCTPAVIVIPQEASLMVGDTQQFFAHTSCDSPGPVGTYTWDIKTQDCTGSTISSSGVYAAPDSISGTSCTDTVRAIDPVNNNAEGTASVEVFTRALSTTTTTAFLCCQIRVNPNQVCRSRWLMIPTLIVIQSINADPFSIFESKVTYSPANAVTKMSRLVLDPRNIWQLVFVNPPWLAGGATDGELTVTVTTVGMPAFGTTYIQMLPLGLDGQGKKVIK